MAIWWTIEYAEAEKSVADWGMVNLQFNFENQGADEATFTVIGATIFDAAEVFEFDTELIFRKRTSFLGGVYSGGVIWFRGRVKQTPRTAAPDSEYQGYRVANAWQDLEEIVYRQSCLTDAGGLPTSAVFLNVGMNQAQQITHVLDWARLAPPDGSGQTNLTVGTIGVTAPLLPSQDQDRFCADIIRDQLHISPDAVGYWDYSTTPPTIHVKRRLALSAVAITMPGDFDEGSITERKDLQIPVVQLNFRKTVVVDNALKWHIATQIYPGAASGLERRGLVHTFNLEGGKVTTLKSALVCDTVNAAAGSTENDATRLAWWKDRVPILGNSADVDQTTLLIGSVTIKDKDGNTVSLDDYPRELIGTTLPAWLAALYGFSKIKVFITATVKCKLVKSATLTEFQACWDCTLTDATTGSYQTLAQVDPGETAPAGLAQYIYESHATLQYQGTISTTAEEVDGVVRPGKVLNLNTASGRFTAMNALVQKVTEDIDAGRTTITFGPPAHLGPAELMEYLRQFNYRKLYENPATQDGDFGDAEIDMSAETPRANTAMGSDTFRQLVVKPESGTAKFDLNPADCGSPGRVLKAQQIIYLNEDCVEKKRWFLCSDEEAV